MDPDSQRSHTDFYFECILVYVCVYYDESVSYKMIYTEQVITK